MDVTLALLCDAANVTTEGNLNILGQFNTITASSFPAVHPVMRLVLRFRASPAELGDERSLTIKTLTEDGEIIGEISGRMTASTDAPLGKALESPPLIWELVNMTFEQPGDYAFSILIDRDEKAVVALAVVGSSADAEVPHGS